MNPSTSLLFFETDARHDLRDRGGMLPPRSLKLMRVVTSGMIIRLGRRPAIFRGAATHAGTTRHLTRLRRSLSAAARFCMGRAWSVFGRSRRCRRPLLPFR